MKSVYSLLNFCIALVWLVNGLFCKILNFVPRHQAIVAKILGEEYARTFTVFIGFAELIMAVWILTGFKSRLTALSQILVVATMNVLEFFLAPELLSWGRLNLLFALVFCIIVYFNEFHLKKTGSK